MECNSDVAGTAVLSGGCGASPGESLLRVELIAGFGGLGCCSRASSYVEWV